MNVHACIDKYKNSTKHKITKIWLCPKIVKHPKVSGTYVIETSISSKLSESLYNSKVVKYWIEPSDCLCIVFDSDDKMYENKHESLYST